MVSADKAKVLVEYVHLGHVCGFGRLTGHGGPTEASRGACASLGHPLGHGPPDPLPHARYKLVLPGFSAGDGQGRMRHYRFRHGVYGRLHFPAEVTRGVVTDVKNPEAFPAPPRNHQELASVVLLANLAEAAVITVQ